MAQQYGTIAAHTRRHAFVLVVFVVLRAHVQFCLFDKADATATTPIPTFSDTAITNCQARLSARPGMLALLVHFITGSKYFPPAKMLISNTGGDGGGGGGHGYK